MSPTSLNQPTNENENKKNNSEKKGVKTDW